MPEGKVVFYRNAGQFGFIRPNEGDGRIYFHYSRGTLGGSVRHVPMPVPKVGDRVVYTLGRPREDGRVFANSWTLADIKERLNTLTPEQQRLKQRVLGLAADQWEIWNATDELGKGAAIAHRELFGSYFTAQQTSGAPRGTFNQVLLWARFYMAEHGYEGAPPFSPWPDMPRYRVRYLSDGKWTPTGLAWYTKVQAEAFAARLRQTESRPETSVRVADLWPTAPRLSVAGAATVLAACGRDVLKDDWTGASEVSWIDNQWGQPAEVATAYFGGDNPWVTIDGQTYTGEEARHLQFCGRILRFDFN
jgi:cold shock CspA family protein